MSKELLKHTLTKFGAAIRSFRQRLGISQEELAHRSGLHRTYITDIERGARNLTMDSITKLTRALNVPLSVLFSRIDNGNSKLTVRSRRAPNVNAVDILIVEDHARHAGLTLGALEKNGLANPMFVVSSGEEALDFLILQLRRAGGGGFRSSTPK